MTGHGHAIVPAGKYSDDAHCVYCGRVAVVDAQNRVALHSRRIAQPKKDHE